MFFFDRKACAVSTERRERRSEEGFSGVSQVNWKMITSPALGCEVVKRNEETEVKELPKRESQQSEWDEEITSSLVCVCWLVCEQQEEETRERNGKETTKRFEKVFGFTRRSKGLIDNFSVLNLVGHICQKHRCAHTSLLTHKHAGSVPRL